MTILPSARLTGFLAATLTLAAAAAGETPSTRRFILLNLHPGDRAEAMGKIRAEFPLTGDAPVQVGVATIFSYLHAPRERTIRDITEFLTLAERNDLPAVVQLDGENWWGNRPDLWNWWDPQAPGYSPDNRANVEWTEWSPDAAVAVGWRNWGRQIRVLPQVNLMSPRYRAACHEEMRALVPVILDWWTALPPAKRHLFVGIKLGWESAIGVSSWYYPNGNALRNSPPADDPTGGLDINDLPSRGVATLGYAAATSAGIRSEGTLTEADQAEVVRRHLEDLSRLASELGVPRDRLFTHAGGWKDNEMLYQSALNEFSCPGWSFYRHAADPAKDVGVRNGLEHSDAPYWGAVEWLFQGPRTVAPWRSALETTLAQPRCRYLCIYNWRGIQDSPDVLEAIRQTCGTP